MISLSSSEFTSECKYKFIFKKLQILQNSSGKIKYILKNEPSETGLNTQRQNFKKEKLHANIINKYRSTDLKILKNKIQKR